MNELTIVDYMSHDPVLKNCFKGVMAYDELPSSIEEGLYIVNTDTSNGPGKHWVAILVRQNDILYFDSLGQAPKELKSYLTKQKMPYKYSIKRLQSLTSDVCGNYCILFGYFSCRGYSLQRFLNLFTKYPVKNDKMVVL